MLWLVAMIAVSIAGGIAILVQFASRRFKQRVAQEVEQMWMSLAEPHPVDLRSPDALPAPVRSYLTKALGTRETAVRTMRFRHGGKFRTKLDGSWQPIRGQQYAIADPPGFLWWGRLRAGPGFWVDARDRCVNGIGSMLVSLESTFTLTDRSGPEMDQGSMLRLLSEMVLFPTSLADPRYVTWSAMGDRRARATLSLNGRKVMGVFEFGEDDLPRGFFAERYYDTGHGRAELRPWSGEYASYREVDGMLIPHHFVGYWHMGGKPVPYVDFQLETPEYDKSTPF